VNATATFRVETGFNRVPDYDPVGSEHVWTISAVFRLLDPPAAAEIGVLLDSENLVAMTPVFCIHCEQPWTVLLADAPCDGEPAR
jgi:hypothetical protein